MGLDAATTVALVRLGMELIGDAADARTARQAADMTDAEILARVRKLNIVPADELIARGAAAAGAGEAEAEDLGEE
jgi:hypothetical protein